MLREIMELTLKLEDLDYGNQAARAARGWLNTGAKCKYTNQDFDILNSLACELYRVIELRLETL